MQVINKVIESEIAELQKNTLDLNHKMFIFNNYKTKSTYKTQLVEIHSDLMQIIKLYLKHHRNKKGDYNFIVNFDGSPFTSSSTLTKRFNKIFAGKKISTAMLRKIYLTSKYKNAMDDLKDDAADMGTSEKTITNHYVKQ